MKQRLLVGAAVVAALCALPLGLSAQAPPAAPEKDPDAMAALEKMGSYLRTLKAFQVVSKQERDDVLVDGQKVEHDGTTELLVRKPDGLYAISNSDRKSRVFFYDGKTFTVYLPRMNMYASATAPGTLEQLGDVLEAKYGIELPLRDLFIWGTDAAQTAAITSARDIGPSSVEGTTCEQYAFRQEGLDWQVWIQLGEYPLPRKMILTTLTDEARPQYSSTLNWNLAPSFNDAAFTFVPPKGTERIVLASAGSGGGVK